MVQEVAEACLRSCPPRTPVDAYWQSISCSAGIKGTYREDVIELYPF